MQPTSPPSLKAPLVPGEAGRSRAWGWRAWMVIAAIAILAVGIGMVWRHQAARVPWRAELPKIPDLSAKPGALATEVREAEAQALSSRTALAGVEKLGRLYHANGYSKEAEICWRILHAEQPGEALWCYYLANLRRTSGDEAEMVSLLEQTVKLAPDYAPAWLALAEIEFKTGRLDAAERDFHRRTALLPGDPYATLGLARVALQNDRPAEGRRLIEQIIRDFPAFSQAHNLYAGILTADGDTAAANKQRWLGRIVGRFREAEDPWITALDVDCYDPTRLATLASIEFETKHADRGKLILERVIQLAPDDYRGYSELGKNYLDLGDPAKARELLEEGIKRSKSSPMLYMNLSQAYRELRQPAEALRAAEQGLALMPESAELQNARGVALQAAGRLEEAIATYRATIEHAPNVAEANFNLGTALLQLGRKDEAYVALKRALGLEPTHPKALAVLGELELNAGRLESAMTYLGPLYEFYPGMATARRLMVQWDLQAGMVAIRERRMDEAERVFRDGIAVDPGSAELHGRLGLLYAQQARLTDAQEQLESFRLLQPSDPRASLFLGQVYLDLHRSEDARRVLMEGRQLARNTGNSAIASQCDEALQRLPK